MLVGELITRLREDYLDDTLGVDENDSLVSEKALIRFAREAQDQACRRHELIYDDTTAAVATITIVAGTEEYLIHTRITRLIRVSHNGLDLKKITEREMEPDDPLWRQRDNATPTHYYVRDRRIHLYPVPDADAVTDASTIQLAVYRKPINNILSKANSFEIFEESQDDLIYWMLYRVYNLRDEDINNPTDAAMYLNLFEEVYGPVIPIDVRTHQLESPIVQTLRPAKAYNYSGESNVDPEFDSSGWS